MIQAIKCPCGKVFAGCVEPYCYTESSWQKDVRKYIKKGCTVSTIESTPLQECTCKDFKPESSNQLELTNR